MNQRTENHAPLPSGRHPNQRYRVEEKKYEEPGLDDAADVLAAALHIDLELLGLTVLGKHGQSGAGNLTVSKMFKLLTFFKSSSHLETSF